MADLTSHLQSTKLLSLDPAQRDTGYAILNKTTTPILPEPPGATHTVELELYYASHFSSYPNSSIANGLIRVEQSVLNLVDLYRPEQVALEVRMPTMQSSAIWRMRTDGVIHLSLAKRGLVASEYYPVSIASFFHGPARPKNRTALKKATRDTLARLFNIAIQTADASDAASIACYHALCGPCPLRDSCKVRTKGLDYLTQQGCEAFKQITLKAGGPILATPPPPTRKRRNVSRATPEVL